MEAFDGDAERFGGFGVAQKELKTLTFGLPDHAIETNGRTLTDDGQVKVFARFCLVAFVGRTDPDAPNSISLANAVNLLGLDRQVVSRVLSRFGFYASDTPCFAVSDQVPQRPSGGFFCTGKIALSL